MNKIGGYAGWRWHVKTSIISQHYADKPRVFIIEGLFTVLLAITSFFLIAPLPENVTFLTPSEKSLLLKRLEDDHLTATSEDKTPLTLSQIIKTMTHWKIVLPFVPLTPPPPLSAVGVLKRTRLLACFACNMATSATTAFRRCWGRNPSLFSTVL
jgi:hypothetical protein